MLISLLMHCFYCILTSLISQALLQAALDKKERVFTSWFIQCEFLNLPVSAARSVKHSNVSCNASRLATTGTGLPGWLRKPLQEALAQQACKIDSRLPQAYQVSCLATAAGKASREASEYQYRHRERHQDYQA
jgi:hypothetical protein